MALKPGTPAPPFTLPSTSGQPFRLQDHAGKPLILYFYPKDFTAVCTKEACGFRDEFGHFTGLGITVVGISRDDIPTHLRFKAQYNLPFELLADEAGTVSHQYSGKVPLIGLSNRVTFLIDGAQQVRAVYSDFFAGQKHIDQMKAEVAALLAETT
jgi:thioredoxin-dependent peroxiredoxin